MLASNYVLELEVITLPKRYTTDVLTDDQLEFVAKRLPEPHATTGRPAYTNLELLPGILKVLRSGSRWRDLDRSDCPSDVTHWRRLRFWQKHQGFNSLWQYLLKLLMAKQKLVPKVSSIDGTLIGSFAFADTTSYSGKHHQVGTKVSVAVDKGGIPLASEEAKGSTHDITLAPQTVTAIPRKIRNHVKTMLADKGYDSSTFRNFLAGYDISSDIPKRELPIVYRQKILQENLLKRNNHKVNVKRFVVERTNAWTKSFRRLRFRFDYTMLSFSAFLNLAFVVICVRKLMS